MCCVFFLFRLFNKEDANNGGKTGQAQEEKKPERKTMI